MTPARNVLGDVIIYGGDGREIAEEAISRIEHNYPGRPTVSHAFYRETIRKRKSFNGISEEMMDIYKSSYKHRDIRQDRIRITKSRRLLSQRANDTLAVKIEGGPFLAV